MASIRESNKTNARVIPQIRSKGSGTGRKLFPWKSSYPWLVIASEQLCTVASGSEGGLLEDRNWSKKWNISPEWLRKELEVIFPGICDHLDSAWSGVTPWERNLLNRVYKMYYSGTSDRGSDHDPKTRATISREHWRCWSIRTKWESKILRIVSRRLRCRVWRNWIW